MCNNIVPISICIGRPMGNMHAEFCEYVWITFRQKLLKRPFISFIEISPAATQIVHFFQTVALHFFRQFWGHRDGIHNSANCRGVIQRMHHLGVVYDETVYLFPKDVEKIIGIIQYFISNAEPIAVVIDPFLIMGFGQ